ncbi:putative SWI/SNF-related matrix-associated actin-dependent regulator of chromatin subfamily A member 3-like 1 [Colletotrichum fructicola]|nr:putative SWI/SNF-related matrix-associated actin-dependent regulator of chromatin subfamily A member 3-like 1 [Colletotrichum fructicola]
MDTSQSTSGADTRNETVSAIPKNYVCFGSIVDAIALLKPGAEKSVVPDERLTKHFHIQAVGGYFGLFDSETCVAITLKAIISSHRWSLKVKNLRKEPKSTFSKVDLYIYGIETDAAQVGDILCTAKINLQRPLTDIDGMRYVNPHYLPIFHSSSEDVKSLRVRSSMRPGGTDLGRKPSDSSSFDTDVQSILNSLSHNEILHAEPVDGKVRSELYMHQKHAIDYIFKRETGQLPPELMLWRFNDDDDSAKFWEHKITGAQELDPHEIKGGIIADEMGLGKSLVVLSSIAGSIDRSFRYLERMHESYARVSAQISNPPSPSHATLIIVPSSMLIDSWMEEISRHILQGSLDVFRFHGDKRKSDAKLLSTSNIVITTYATVASDAVSKSRILQNINWFRIVLDEAHYVRNSRTKSFEAINSLVSEHRWCLTGTPIQNGLDDLGSLLSFLKIPVFEHPATFKQLISSRIDSSFMQIWNPKPLRVLLASICLRRTRESVKLPQPSLQQRLLELNTVEREQYMAILSSTGYASQMAVR